MEEIKEKKMPFIFRMSKFLLAMYMVALYIFDARGETLGYSKLIFLAFAACTSLYILQRRKIYIGTSVMPAYLTCAWFQASVFWATSGLIAGIMARTMWQIFVLFFLVYNLLYEDETAHDYFVKCLYIAGIVLCVYSIYTYGINGIIDALMSGTQRLGKEISQENVFGMQLAITTITAFYYISFKNSHKIFHTAVFVVSFVVAMSSGSRKSLIMVVFGILFLIYIKYGIRKLYKTVLTIAIIGVLFMSIIKLPLFSTVYTRMQQAVFSVEGQAGGDGSTKRRIELIQVAYRIFKDKMFLGCGINNFRIESGFWTYAHNNFLEILADIGLIGGILYYSMYLKSFLSLRKGKSNAAGFLMALFLVRLFCEFAMVTYYDKMQWIMMAIFMLPCEKERKEISEAAQYV